MMIRRIAITAALAAATVFTLSAQTESAEDYHRRYEGLTSRVGLGGAGVESLLSRWEADYPEDVQMLEAKYLYYFTKCRESRIVQKSQDKFLGVPPVLSLADSLGNPVNYFEEYFYDDELYGQADAAIEKAVRVAPERLDLRLARVSTMMAYEKESPDMAASALRQIIDYNYVSHPSWTFSEAPVDNDAFKEIIQDYLVTLYQMATPASRKAFKDLSEKMTSYNPKEVIFLNNVGSYYMAEAKDNKTALKYFNKVLKLKPSDETAIRNCIIIARSTKDVKMEKKYLAMMAKYASSEVDRQSATVRLNALNEKKK